MEWVSNMPSVQSYFFKVITKVMSLRMNSIASVPELRTFSERMSGDSISKSLLPDGTTLNRIGVDGVPVEWVNPPQVSSKSVILYLHGGGWILGWYNSYRSLVARIGLAAKSRVLAVDYRLAPENPYPAALEDSLAVYRWLLRDGIESKQIVIAGDSAGGNLTLTTLMALRDAGEPMPAAAVCISPMTDLAATGESFWKNRDALLTTKLVLSMAGHYIGSQDAHLPMISPHYGNLEGLPPLLIHVGGDEILLSDAERLAAKARGAGVEVDLVIWPKMWHVWHVYAPYLPEAQQAVDEIGSFVRKNIVGVKEQRAGYPIGLVQNENENIP